METAVGRMVVSSGIRRWGAMREPKKSFSKPDQFFRNGSGFALNFSEYGMIG
jgi:hypothetical protein